jgi:hypothetical protein
MSALRIWISLAVAIVALPAFAQVQSRVESRVDTRVESRIPQGLGHPQITFEPERPLFTPCFRALQRPSGALVVLNCQPFPPL